MQCETLDPKRRSHVKEEICSLGEAVTFFLHECPGFNKASMLWAQGLLHLLLLFYFQDGSQTSFAESIRQKLRCFHVHPQTYTWTRLQAQNAVYMKTTVDWRHFCVVVCCALCVVLRCIALCCVALRFVVLCCVVLCCVVLCRVVLCGVCVCVSNT